MNRALLDRESLERYHDLAQPDFLKLETFKKLLRNFEKKV